MNPEPKYAYHKKNKNIVKQSREKTTFVTRPCHFTIEIFKLFSMTWDKM